MFVTPAHHAALHYVTLTQNRQYSPETRARFRAEYANEYESFTLRAGQSLYLFCLHVSLFLFAAGLLIYFFNINRATFYAVVWLVAIATGQYAFSTVLPFFHRYLHATPFSSIVLRMYLGVLYAMVQVFSWIKPLHGPSIQTKKHHRDLSDRYRLGVIEGNAKLLREAALKPSSAIDAEVLECMLLVLDDDHALETFFDAVPGFCGSKLVQPLHSRVRIKLQQSLDGFLDRTFSSRLSPESVRNDLLITCLNAAHSALGPIGASRILGNFFHEHRVEALKSVELGHSLISWGHSIDDSINPIVRRIVACIIAHAQDRDERWTKLVKEAFDIPDGIIRDYPAHGDSMSLTILNHVTRKALRTGHSEQGVLESLSQFDIHSTAAELRHDFCALWNEIVQEARNERFGSIPTQILAGIRHLFITLHQDTNAAPNDFSAFLDSIKDFDAILGRPSSYPKCNIPGHHPDSATGGHPQFGIRPHSEPASLRLHRTQSCSHFPTVSLPTRPRYPRISLPRPASVTLPPLTSSPDVIADDTMPDFTNISVILGTAGPTHGPSSSSGPTVQQVEETRMTPTSVVLGGAATGPLPTPLLTPALSHSTISATLPSSMDPVTTQTHFLHHPPGAPALTTTP